jgi:hypothetical protein
VPVKPCASCAGPLGAGRTRLYDGEQVDAYLAGRPVPGLPTVDDDDDLLDCQEAAALSGIPLARMGPPQVNPSRQRAHGARRRSRALAQPRRAGLHPCPRPRPSGGGGCPAGTGVKVRAAGRHWISRNMPPTPTLAQHVTMPPAQHSHSPATARDTDAAWADEQATAGLHRSHRSSGTRSADTHQILPTQHPNSKPHKEIRSVTAVSILQPASGGRRR